MRICSAMYVHIQSTNIYISKVRTRKKLMQKDELQATREVHSLTNERPTASCRGSILEQREAPQPSQVPRRHRDSVKKIVLGDRQRKFPVTVPVSQPPSPSPPSLPPSLSCPSLIYAPFLFFCCNIGTSDSRDLR